MKTDLKTENCSDDFRGLGVGAALPCPWGFDWAWGIVPYSGCTCLGPAMLTVLLCPLAPAKTLVWHKGTVGRGAAVSPLASEEKQKELTRLEQDQARPPRLGAFAVL